MVNDTNFCKVVDNVKHSGTSHVQAAYNIFFNLLKGVYSSYLVLTFGNIVPIRN